MDFSGTPLRSQPNPGDIFNALRRNNYLAAIGRIKSETVQIDLLTNTDLKTPEEFRDLIVSQRNDATIRLGDVAKVELGSEEPMMNAIYGGKPAVYVSVWPLPGSNEIEVAHNLRAEMSRLKENLPTNIDMQLAFDATMFMENAINEISKTLVETIIIVGIVVFLFMGHFARRLSLNCHASFTDRCCPDHADHGILS